MDRKLETKKKRTEPGCLPAPEAVFYAERWAVISEQGRDCGLQKDRIIKGSEKIK